MSDISSRLFNASVRVERMFWLPGFASFAPDDWRDFVEDDLSDADALLASLPWLKEFLDLDWVREMDAGDLADELPAEFYRKGCDGFIVQLATPVPTNFHKEGRGFSFSWGYYQTTWFYFSTLEDLVARAEQFSAEVVEKERAKQSATT